MKFNPNKLLFLIPAFVFAVMIGTSGCNDSGVVEPPPAAYDSNVVIYKGVAAFYWFQGTNDTSYMGVDLWLGDSVRQISTTKDMELTIVPPYDTTNYFFRSGNISQILAGFSMRFNRIYENMSESSFDTLSVIPDSNQLLDSLDFTSDDTYNNGAWPYFVFYQAEKPVYSFYLSGKYANGTTGGHRVYGVFHVKSVERVFAPQYSAVGVMITIDIKLNKVGINHFVH